MSTFSIPQPPNHIPFFYRLPITLSSQYKSKEFIVFIGFFLDIAAFFIRSNFLRVTILRRAFHLGYQFRFHEVYRLLQVYNFILLLCIQNIYCILVEYTDLFR